MDTPSWVSDAVFYEIFVDRFAKSERISKADLNLEAWEAAPTRHGFKGGDLLGVAEHLDYLRARRACEQPCDASTHVAIEQVSPVEQSTTGPGWQPTRTSHFSCPSQ